MEGNRDRENDIFHNIVFIEISLLAHVYIILMIIVFNNNDATSNGRYIYIIELNILHSTRKLNSLHNYGDNLI